MKKSLYILFFFFAQKYFAQEKVTEVRYNQILNGVENSAKLLFTKDQSIYVVNYKHETTNPKRLSDGSILVPPNSIDSIANKKRFVFYDKNEKTFCNNIINNDQEIILKEKIAIKWKLMKEKKFINHIEVHKAEGMLNNRKYIIWYSKKIGSGFGPLKVNGVKGLIIELSCPENNLYVKAESIRFNVVNSDIHLYKKKNFTNTMTRKEYDEMTRKRLEELKNNSNLPILQ